MSSWKWFVYILECDDNTFYTGLTWNISNRFEQHILKIGSNYTKKHRVKRLAYYEEHDNLEVARKRERQIKDWSQAKKRKLIEGKWHSQW